MDKKVLTILHWFFFAYLNSKLWCTQKNCLVENLLKLMGKKIFLIKGMQVLYILTYVSCRRWNQQN